MTDVYMLLMVEKGIRGRICQVIYRCAEIINTWKIIIKIKIRHILWLMAKKFVKNYGEDSNKMFEIDSRSLKLAYVVPEVKVTSVEKALIIK